MPSESSRLRGEFGEIDIYLFDQLLRGRLDRRRRVLDAGCGDGRNLVYLLRNGFTCIAVDRERRRVPHFAVAELDALPLPDACVDVVICSAVLHFADDAAHFGRMVTELWRVLAPGGMLFARLASNIGIEDAVGAAGRLVRLPDGSDRFVVDQAMLLDWTSRLGGQLLDPIKTTNVQQMRAMTTWVVGK